MVKVIISGTKQAIAKAEQLVRSITHPLNVDIPCPKGLASALIGDDGSHINSIREYCEMLIRGASGSSTEEQDPFAPGVRIDVLGAWVDHDDTTVTVRVESGDKKVLHQCAAVVRQEIKDLIKSEDNLGDEGRALRKEANKWALLRSHQLDRAHQAYKNDQHDEAREWRDKANVSARRMRNANLQARDVIFKHHNEGKGPLFLDLHGLYVREALHFLGIRLDKFLANNVDDLLECVTGAGRNSEHGIAKIKAAVHEEVTKRRLKYEVINDGAYTIHC